MKKAIMKNKPLVLLGMLAVALVSNTYGADEEPEDPMKKAMRKYAEILSFDKNTEKEIKEILTRKVKGNLERRAAIAEKAYKINSDPSSEHYMKHLRHILNQDDGYEGYLTSDGEVNPWFESSEEVKIKGVEAATEILGVKFHIELKELIAKYCIIPS